MTKKRITTRYIESTSDEMAQLKDQVKDEHQSEMFRPADLVWAYEGSVCVFETMKPKKAIVGFTFRYGQFGRKGYCSYSLATHTYAIHSSQDVAKRWVRREMLKGES